jgi:hypothetical protein
MGAPRTQEETMRMRRRLALVMAIAMLAVAVGAVTASADVERYQYEKSTYLLDLDLGTHFYHEYTATLNESTSEYEYTGSYLGNTLPGSALFAEAVSDWLDEDPTISFRSDYLDGDGELTGYWFEFAGTVADVDVWTGSGTSSTGQEFTDKMTLTKTDSERSDYNHGQYVKDAEDKKAAAHSLIGMPVQSQKKSK